MIKYYWLSYYKITKFGCVFEEDVIKEHPFIVMSRMREKCEECNLTLINFIQISREDYKCFLGE